MKAVLNIICIICAFIGNVACEQCIQTCIYDMLELKETIEQLKTALKRIDDLEKEIERQKNKTKGK